MARLALHVATDRAWERESNQETPDCENSNFKKSNSGRKRSATEFPSAVVRGITRFHALALLQEMRRQKLKPDKVNYSAAISACGTGGQWMRALVLLEEMGREMLTPEVITCNAAISACARGAQVVGALRPEKFHWY